MMMQLCSCEAVDWQDKTGHCYWTPTQRDPLMQNINGFELYWNKRFAYNSSSMSSERLVVKMFLLGLLHMPVLSISERLLLSNECGEWITSTSLHACKTSNFSKLAARYWTQLCDAKTSFKMAKGLLMQWSGYNSVFYPQIYLRAILTLL